MKISVNIMDNFINDFIYEFYFIYKFSWINEFVTADFIIKGRIKFREGSER